MSLLCKIFTISVLLLCFAASSSAQENSPSVVNFHIFQPGAFVYEDLGNDDEGEIDLYVNGHPQFSLQLLGIDFLTKTNIRFGLGFGAGFSKPSTNAADTDAVLGILSGGLVLQLFKGSIRLEAGIVYGRSFKEALNKSQKDDSALYFGLSFPTKLSDMILGKD